MTDTRCVCSSAVSNSPSSVSSGVTDAEDIPLSRRTAPVIPLFPIISGTHSLGALWGLLTRPEEFHQTEKEPGEQEVK
jgi:hypothetical protein